LVGSAYPAALMPRAAGAAHCIVLPDRPSWVLQQDSCYGCCCCLLANHHIWAPLPLASWTLLSLQALLQASVELPSGATRHYPAQDVTLVAYYADATSDSGRKLMPVALNFHQYWQEVLVGGGAAPQVAGKVRINDNQSKYRCYLQCGHDLGPSWSVSKELTHHTDDNPLLHTAGAFVTYPPPPGLPHLPHCRCTACGLH
jgi:hypothetical protein